MPVYAYRCTSCGHIFEEMMGMKDPNPACPRVLDHITTMSGDAAVICLGESVKVPSPVSRPLGGDTPIHYRDRGAR